MFREVMRRVSIITLFVAVTSAMVYGVPLGLAACAGVVMAALALFSVKYAAEISPRAAPAPMEDRAQ